MAARHAGEQRGLGGEHDGRIVVVVPGKEAVAAGEALRARIDSAGGRATVGVVAAEPGPQAVADASLEARGCLRTLLTLGRTGEVSDPAGLGLARLVLGDSGPEALDAFVDAAIGPVLAYDERRGTNLVETMEAWFAAGTRPAEAARALLIHPNTVAQRLDRVSRLLGPGWRDPGRALDLQMALRLYRLRRS
jgi:DNA-binding PucR family transcriptional regulator